MTLSEGPVLFGRNRESRSREAAGAGIWPEAVPRKMSGRKGRLLKSLRIRSRSRSEKARTVRTIFSFLKLLCGDLTLIYEYGVYREIMSEMLFAT